MIQPSTRQLLDELVRMAGKEELLWVTGYLNGLLAGTTPAAPTTKKITVLYGTETGNAKKLALQFTAAAKKRSLPVQCVSAEQYEVSKLLKEEVLLVVISTQGEGEPPLAARKFYDALMRSTDKLDQLQFSVLALGDSSYPLFCKTGIDVDDQLSRLGAHRIVPLQTCDVDVEVPAAAWTNQVLDLFQAATAPAAQPGSTPVKKAGRTILEGRIRVNINLHDQGSTQQTYHLEIETAEDLDHEPGDSIAIVPSNRPEVVAEILALAGAPADHPVRTPKFEGQLGELLTNKLNICYLLSSSVKKYAEITEQVIPDTRMDLVDLLRRHPVREASQFLSFVESLHPIAPRLYSIASTASTHPREVHLTVSRRRFVKEDAQHFGLCSSFLGDLPVGSAVHFYIHRNKQFRLPAADKDIIMIGPGTGIASFRAFLAERDHQAAPGKNWLFFGEKDFTKDFLYQTEVQQYVQTGVLQKLNLAFEQNHPKKARVEDDLKAQGQELYAWLEQGASLYLSGLKDQLNAQVDEALQEILQLHGRKSPEQAKAYLEQLKKESRYHKDLY